MRVKSEVNTKGHFVTPRRESIPESESELFERAADLAGISLGSLAARYALEVPPSLARNKGWVGMLLETALGASAGSRAEPDFPGLGVELKSVPVDAKGSPTETTFVCSIELPDLARSEWGESRLRKKLARVLWVPILADRNVPLVTRIIGAPVLWSPSEEEERTLRADWDLLVETMSLGRTSELTARVGEVLQVRPKARLGSTRRRTLDDEGALYDEQPKGFYLRKVFTRAILDRALILPK